MLAANGVHESVRGFNRACAIRKVHGSCRILYFHGLSRQNVKLPNFRLVGWRHLSSWNTDSRRLGSFFGVIVDDLFEYG